MAVCCSASRVWMPSDLKAAATPCARRVRLRHDLRIDLLERRGQLAVEFDDLVPRFPPLFLDDRRGLLSRGRHGLKLLSDTGRDLLHRSGNGGA